MPKVEWQYCLSGKPEHKQICNMECNAKGERRKILSNKSFERNVKVLTEMKVFCCLPLCESLLLLLKVETNKIQSLNRFNMCKQAKFENL